MNEEKVLLGYTRPEYYGEKRPIYVSDFRWSCSWYWSGGYIGNKNLHCHFDGCFLETPDVRGHPLGNFTTPWNVKENGRVISNGCSIWEDVSTFLTDSPFVGNKWWRIKDLFKQFYVLRNSAEVFQYGGHCCSDERSPDEINKEMATKINLHLQNVIIPLLRQELGFKSENPKMTAN